MLILQYKYKKARNYIMVKVSSLDMNDKALCENTLWHNQYIYIYSLNRIYKNITVTQDFV